MPKIKNEKPPSELWKLCAEQLTEIILDPSRMLEGRTCWECQFYAFEGEGNVARCTNELSPYGGKLVSENDRCEEIWTYD